jgi:photosystem II stability/assembly factor-like uncharacterized protein
MKRIVIGFLLSLAVSFVAFGRWNPQKSNTTASLGGLSIVNANVVWAGGTGGTFVRTTDGGETWQAGTVPGGEKLDFRDVYAVDAKTAYLLSYGNQARIYKTTDGGKNWLLEYTEQNPKAALDCIAFWNATRGIVVGDPLDGKSELLTTSDGGAHWTPLQTNTTTAFAVGPTGMDYSIDGGKNWDQMNEVSAYRIYTIAFADAHHGWAVGRQGVILKFEGAVPAGRRLR